MLIGKVRPALLLAAFVVCGPIRAQDEKKPASIAELRAAIQKELDEVGYGSAGVALVSKEKTIWADGVGAADAAAGRRADVNTYWRVGSISKSFVGLAALILEERGKLRLTDPVAALAPEIAIRNRWQDENPVRLAHLLEHTAGLDDLHFKDYASNDPTPLSLRQGLEHVRDSLYCRWPPGLHSSYSNAGPAVAAYIVQKLDGRSYEQFVVEEILAPLRMTGAGLLLTDEIEAGLAAGYDGGGERAPYRHIVVRPSGALNATPAQMANFVRMLLNRGELDGRRLVSPQAIERMERPQTTLAARLPLDFGYGLGNFSRPASGFVFRGHNGGMTGYLAEYGYLPDQGLGYCVMVSVSNGRLLSRVRNLVREYLVRGVEKPEKPGIGEMPADIDRWTGYYRSITPRNEYGRWAERLDVDRIRRVDDRLVVSRLFAADIEFYPVVGRAFKRRLRSAMTTLAFVQGPDGEKYVQGERRNRRKVSAAVVWFERAAAGLVVLLLLSGPAWALVWIPLKLLGKLKGRPVALRIWPLLALAALPAAVGVLGLGAGDPIERLGKPSLAGIGFVVFSWLFVLLAAWALIRALRSDPRQVGRFVRWHAAAVSSACLIAAVYLLSYRAIGFPPWQ